MNALRRYSIAGLLVVVPIWGTYLILKTLFTTVDGVLSEELKKLGVYYWPGFGIVILILLILCTGVLTTHLFGRRFLYLWERFLRKLPLVRNIYTLIRSIVSTVTLQEKEGGGFRRVVFLQYPSKGFFSIGFVTGEFRARISKIGHEQLVNVFVPTTPTPFTGFLLHLPESEIIPVSLTVEEAMKMVVAAGLYCPTTISDLKTLPDKK